MWENANTNLLFLLCEHSIKLSQIRINSKHFILIMVIWQFRYDNCVLNLGQKLR